MREDAFDPERALREDFDTALQRLNVEALRQFVRALGSAEAPEESKVREKLVEFASRQLGQTIWMQDDPRLVEESERWAHTKQSRGKIDLEQVDRLLARAHRAVLAGRATVARRCYESMLTGLAELEVSGGHVRRAPRQAPLTFAGDYLVSVYESESSEQRVGAMFEAIVGLSVLGPLTRPLELLLAAAVRPLADFEAFARAWARMLEELAEGDRARRSDDWRPSDALLAEALEHVHSLDGVARMARRSNDLSHYRTWISRLAHQEKWELALDVVIEHEGALVQPTDRAIMLDAGLTLARQTGDQKRMTELAERAMLAAPTIRRMVRWLLADQPDRATILARSLRVVEICPDTTPRMRALLAAVQGAFHEVALLLEDSGDGWDDEEHPGRVAFPVLLIAFYGGPKGTPIASKLCAPLFGVKAKHPDADIDRWDGRDSLPEILGKVDVPSPGSSILDALHEVQSKSDPAQDLGGIPWLLRDAASRRGARVLATKERQFYEHAALLIVAAAEATFRAGNRAMARAYLGEMAQAATRQSTFRSALTKTLGKSALVNAL